MSPKLLGLIWLGLFSVAALYGQEKGEASYYPNSFQGLRTANGEYYHPDSLTAAHPTLAFNTQVKVTNLANRKSVIVRINDRGPFIEGRIIDLSYVAAKKLNFIKKGITPVKVEIISD